MRKNIKVIIGIVIGITIGALSGVYATLSYTAGDIEYTKSGTNTKISVANALNELYQNKKETTDNVRNITQNGSVQLDKYYKNLNVNVPIPAGYIQPSGTQNITSNGNYDITNKANVNVNVTVAGTKTLLWTNSNPSSDFEKQNVTLSSSLSNYTHILIQWKNIKTSSTIYDDIFKILPQRINANETGGFMFGGRDNGNESKVYVRWAYVQDENIRFARSMERSGVNVDNSRCVPVAIYGLNISY